MDFGPVLETLAVVESTSVICSLSEEQANELRRIGKELKGRQAVQGFLLGGEDLDYESNRSIISCDLRSPGTYSVRVANAIGVVSLPGLQIHVTPKIPLSHLVHLAQYSSLAPRIGSTSVQVKSLNAFWELICNWCIHEIDLLVRSGLLTDYKTLEDELPHVRGTVDVRRSTNEFLRGRPVVHCRYDDHDRDFALNRILLAAVRTVVRDTHLTSQALKVNALRLQGMLYGIGELQEQDFRVAIDRRTAHYSRAIDLCRYLLLGVGMDLSEGAISGRTFLIPTPYLVEDGIRELLRRELVPVIVTKYGKTVPGNSHFTVNPDLIFDKGQVVGDVKYRIAESSWDRGSVAQISMFANAFFAKKALIATFSTSEADQDLFMQLGELSIFRILWHASEHLDPASAKDDFILRCRSVVETAAGLDSLSKAG